MTQSSLQSVLASRRDQIRFRLGISAVTIVIYLPLLGWRGPLLWLVTYSAIQLLEYYGTPGRDEGWLARHPRMNDAVAVVLLFLNSTVFGWFSILEVNGLGPWGEVCAVSHLTGAIVNSVLTTINCRAALWTSLMPFIVYIGLLPVEAMLLASPPDILIVLGLAQSLGLLVVGVFGVWRGFSRAKQAEAAAVQRDIEERAASEAKLLTLARTDSLTGLPNRAVVQERLGDIVAATTPAALLMVDLDSFKFVNDTLGHSAGDQVLREIGQRIAAASRTNDVVARLGGDEFALLLPGVFDSALASQIGDRVMSAISEPVMMDEHPINIGASIGIALYPVHGRTVDELISSADLALYKAKAEGRHCSRFYSPILRTQARNRVSRDSELHAAIKRGELELYYQPQIRLADNATAGAEALLRWRHPTEGLLKPAAFLSALESGRLAAQVGDWVMETACRQGAHWRRNGLPDFRIAINLFGAQFRSGDLVAKVTGVLAKTGLPPQALEVEITENVILRHEDSIIAPLRELRAKGIGIAFDDYGTGYASLSLLKNFPLTRLKIDQSFTRTVCDNPSDAAIVRAVVTMAQAFNLQVIAEGVETEQQADAITQCGCDEAQGYLFGSPMTASEFTQLAVEDQAARRLALPPPPALPLLSHQAVNEA